MRTNTFFAKKKPAQAMVEFAIALPILLLLLYGLLEAGRLLFLYSTVVTASRQAVRYGATTGENDSGVPRYQDCDGIRHAANAVGYLGQFDTISLAYDQGVTNANPPVAINHTPYCTGVPTDSSLTTTILQGNKTRLVVTVTEEFNPIVPNLVPFIQRPITATSARTILYSVPIVVEQEEQEWFKNPTETEIISHDPNPSEIFGWVTVVVRVTGASPTPTGTVDITGADTNCIITLDSDGEGSCQIQFITAGMKTITAFYNGDADNLASSDVETHEVTLAHTVTTIMSDLPDPSVRNEPFTVIVSVTGGTTTPAGTVQVSGGGSVNCTITLSNGTGSCTLNFNNLGQQTLTADYTGDATHLASSDTESHQVIAGTPTPTLVPTSTTIPSVTPIPYTPTATLSPTPIPSPVPSCNGITAAGGITYSGNTMSITVNNPYGFNLVVDDITVTWNDDKGHQTTADKTLTLQQVRVGSTTVWTGNIANQSTYTIDETPIVGPGNTTITFFFHQSYDTPEVTDNVYINWLTPGCQGNPLDVD